MEQIDLKQLVEQYPEALTDGAKLKSYILEMYPNCKRGIVNILVTIQQCGIVAEMQANKNLTVVDMDRWKRILEDDYGFSEATSEICLKMWYESTRIPVQKRTNNEPSSNDVPIIMINAKSSLNCTYLDSQNAQKNWFEYSGTTLVRLKPKYQKRRGTIYIPDGITTIGARAFDNCKCITAVVISNSIKSIDEQAFRRCESLTSINIPDSVISIGESAFENCSSLISITLPDSITSIGDLAFFGTAYYKDKSNWTNATLYIGNHLIVAEKSISGNFIVNKETKCIGDSAFFGCSNLTSIAFVESITNIGRWSFRECNGLTSISLPCGAKSIGGGAFEGCTNLSSIDIPANIMSIGNGAFYGCVNLASIVIPDSITSIEDSTFSGCIGLKAVTIPNSVTSIGDSAFKGCTSLTSITIPNGVMRIGSCAFCNCTKLATIKIPDSVTSIGWHAFFNIGNGFNLDNGVHYIGHHLIMASNTISGNCIIKAGTKCISDFAFHDCDKLTSITIPDGVTSIGWKAFFHCINLVSVKIPKSVMNIGKEAFCDCRNLTSIDIPDNITNIGYHSFCNCYKLASITIPNGVMEIGYGAFYGCSNLSNIEIPESVSSIGDFAFKDCWALTTVIIPNSMRCIGKEAFCGCQKLNSITLFNGVIRIGKFAFAGTLYYQTESNWVDGVLYIGNHLIKANKTIPDSYTIKDGTKCVADGAFEHLLGLTSVIMPNSITSIGECVFDSPFQLKVAYLSTKSMWETIKKADRWSYRTVTIHCIDGNIQTN